MKPTMLKSIFALAILTFACPTFASASEHIDLRSLTRGLKPATVIKFDLSANNKLATQKLICKFNMVDKPMDVAVGMVNLDPKGQGVLLDMNKEPFMLAPGAKYHFELKSKSGKVIKIDFAPTLANNILKPDSLTIGDPLGI